MAKKKASSNSSMGPRGTDPIVESVYAELRDLAQAKMRGERSGQTLRATELVHEVYLRLRGSQAQNWQNRAHFFAAAAESMRRILIERARARGRVKRGGDSGKAPQRISFADIPAADLSIEYNPNDLLSLETAIEKLERKDLRAAQVVRLRFYGGLSVEETAEALDVAERTVKRDWMFAKAWLVNELGESGLRA
jgi:RNA polymerase sigma factor (TIGR02999 family)